MTAEPRALQEIIDADDQPVFALDAREATQALAGDEQGQRAGEAAGESRPRPAAARTEGCHRDCHYYCAYR